MRIRVVHLNILWKTMRLQSSGMHYESINPWSTEMVGPMAFGSIVLVHKGVDLDGLIFQKGISTGGFSAIQISRFPRSIHKKANVTLPKSNWHISIVKTTTNAKWRIFLSFWMPLITMHLILYWIDSFANGGWPKRGRGRNVASNRLRRRIHRAFKELTSLALRLMHQLKRPL